tara:strand:+ start:337 stop:669 length:333 start_codon:yes stop_codon:yes gene_type:complete
MKYNIIEEKDTIRVIASVPTRRRADNPVEMVNTKKILAILTKEGYNVSNYNTEIETECTNYKQGSTTHGEWVFRKKQTISERRAENEETPEATSRLPNKRSPRRRRTKED